MRILSCAIYRTVVDRGRLVCRRERESEKEEEEKKKKN